MLIILKPIKKVLSGSLYLQDHNESPEKSASMVFPSAIRNENCPEKNCVVKHFWNFSHCY